VKWWALQPAAGLTTALHSCDGKGVALAQMAAWGCAAVSPWAIASLGCTLSALILSPGSETSRSTKYVLQGQIWQGEQFIMEEMVIITSNFGYTGI